MMVTKMFDKNLLSELCRNNTCLGHKFLYGIGRDFVFEDPRGIKWRFAVHFEENEKRMLSFSYQCVICKQLEDGDH